MISLRRSRSNSAVRPIDSVEQASSVLKASLAPTVVSRTDDLREADKFAELLDVPEELPWQAAVVKYVNIRANVDEPPRTGLTFRLVTSLIYDPDGWISLPGQDGADGVHVRLRNRDGHLAITDLYIHGFEITPEIVRGISVSRLQAAFNLALGASLSADPPRVPRISRGLTLQLLGADDEAPEPSLSELRGRAHRKAPETDTQERPRLTRPAGDAPEEFYPRVADAYREYAPRTRAPAKEMAAEAGVPVTTAHRWIREARRRGFLPPARKGTAG